MKRMQLFTIITILAMLLSMASTPTGFAMASTNSQVKTQAPVEVGIVARVLSSIKQFIPLGRSFNNRALGIRKVADAAIVNAGEPIGFTITVGSIGTKTLTEVRVTDHLGTEIGWTENSDKCSIDDQGTLTCYFQSMPPGTIERVHLSALSDGDMCGILTNTAEVVSEGESKISATAKIDILCNSNVVVDKSPEQATILPGERARFILEVRSIGEGTAQDVTLEDQLPTGSGLSWSVDHVSDGVCSIAAGVLTCNFGDLPVNALRTVEVSSPTSVAECGDIDNSATVSATNQLAADAVDDTDAATVTVSCSTLQLEKLVDNESVQLGGDIGYILQVTNTGQTTATNVTINDQLAAGVVWSEDSSSCSIDGNNLLSCSFGSLAAGASASVHVSGASTTAVCGTVSNTATVQAANVSGTVNDTAVLQVICQPSVSVKKVAESNFVAPGSPLHYTITIQNSGYGPATGVVLTDNLPANSDLTWTYANVTGGGTCTIADGVLGCEFPEIPANSTASVQVSAETTLTTCGELINTVDVRGDNFVTVSDAARVRAICSPNITLEKTAEMAEITAGDPNQPARFNITITSNGIGSVNNVILTDELPKNNGLSWVIDSVTGEGTCAISGGTLTCNFGSMPSGSSRTVVISSLTNKDDFCYPTADRQIMNIARVTSDNETLEAQGDNTATGLMEVLCPDLFCETPDTVVFEDFNSNGGSSNWSNYKVTVSPNGTQRFLGEFNNEETVFQYTDVHPQGHSIVSISFDLNILRTWDGNIPEGPPGYIIGPDEFMIDMVKSNGQVVSLLDTTFSNFDWASYVFQSFPNPAFEGNYPAKTGAYLSNTLGYTWNGPLDSTYRFQYNLVNSDPTIRLVFSDGILQSLRDESWGIDNFELRLTHCQAFFIQNNYYFPIIQRNQAQNVQPRMEINSKEQ